MPTVSGQFPDRAIFPTEPVYRLTVENYHDMIAAGILTTEDKVELLEGALICKMAKNPPHRTANLKLQRALTPLLPPNVFPQYQEPITLARSEPEPDGSVIMGSIEAFADRNPPAEAVCLVIEVSDGSLRLDRDLKRRIYAEAGIAVYWIINLVDRVIEVYADPSPPEGSYGQPVVYASGMQVPVKIAGQIVGEIAVDDVLP